MSDQPLPGPSRETLLNLKAMLPSFIQGLSEKKVVGKGLPVSKRPRKACVICGTLYDHAFVKASEETSMGTGRCPKCQGLLDCGYAAIVCGDMFAFLKHKELADWGGTIKQVSPQVMTAIQERFSPKTKYGNNHNGSDSNQEPAPTA